MTEKLRSLRGILCIKIKDTTISVFGIPDIKINDTSEDIIKWKGHSRIKECYNNIFQKSNFPRNPSYMQLILNKIWSNETPHNEQVAWVIAVIQIFLNSSISVVRISEEAVQGLFLTYLVSI